MNLVVRRELVLIAFVALLSNFLVYAPFIFGLNSFLGVDFPKENGVHVLYSHWDGPLYVVVAKNFYDASADYSFYGLPATYYAAHLPLYPLVIRLLSFVGYFNAMLLATTICFLAALYAFYFFVKEFFSKNAFWPTIAFVFLPFRWVLFHSIGASEPLFLALVIASFYFYKKKNLLAAGVLGGLASITRIQGVLLFPAFVIDYYWFNKKPFSLKSISSFSIIPAFLVALFVFYQFAFNNFFAYFAVNAGFLQGFLASVIHYGGQQAGEEYLLLFLLAFVTIGLLYKKKLFAETIFCSLITLQVLFISHNDVSRYLIPVAPFALIVFKNVFEEKWFKLALPFIALGGLIYVYSILPFNVMELTSFAKLFAFAK